MYSYEEFLVKCNICSPFMAHLIVHYGGKNEKYKLLYDAYLEEYSLFSHDKND